MQTLRRLRKTNQSVEGLPEHAQEEPVVRSEAVHDLQLLHDLLGFHQERLEQTKRKWIASQLYQEWTSLKNQIRVDLNRVL